MDKNLEPLAFHCRDRRLHLRVDDNSNYIALGRGALSVRKFEYIEEKHFKCIDHIYGRNEIVDLFQDYMGRVGATPEAIKFLDGLKPISKELKEKLETMAENTKKSVAKEDKRREDRKNTRVKRGLDETPEKPPVDPTKIKKTATAKEKTAHIPPANKAGKPAKPAEPKTKTTKQPAKDVSPKPKKSAAEPKTKKTSAASRFRELILEGKKTDDQIFEIVAGEFELPPNKRRYVAWYRAQLKKQGLL